MVLSKFIESYQLAMLFLAGIPFTNALCNSLDTALVCFHAFTGFFNPSDLFEIWFNEYDVIYYVCCLRRFSNNMRFKA